MLPHDFHPGSLGRTRSVRIDSLALLAFILTPTRLKANRIHAEAGFSSLRTLDPLLPRLISTGSESAVFSLINPRVGLIRNGPRRGDDYSKIENFRAEV